MEQLIIRGNDLGKIRDIANVMGGYTVVKQIIEDGSLPQEFPVKSGTCSACPHFTRVEGIRTEHCLWGECSKHKANVNMYKPFCTSHKAEIKVEIIKED